MSSLPKLKDVRKRDIASAVLYRKSQGEEIAARLSSVAVAAGDLEAQAVADLIAESARDENLWIAKDLRNGDGECFDGYGSLNVSCSRLAPEYMAASASRSRRRVDNALARCSPRWGEYFRLASLTMPRLRGVGFRNTIELFDDARGRLRKRKWFIKTFRGGVFGEEFTLGDERCDAHKESKTDPKSKEVRDCAACQAFEFDFETNGYHVHVHILACAKWVDWTRLGNEWTDCLERAARARGIALEFPTSHGRAVVDVRLVKQKQGGKGTISRDDAVKEVAKYITKGSSFTKISGGQLLEVERTLRGRHMVETFGDANLRKGKPAQDVAVEKARGDRKPTYVHTKAQLTATQPSLKPFPVLGARPKPRLEPLRVLGARMIAAGKRRQWLETLRDVFRERAEWRKRQLAEKYPRATFTTLAGEVWYGVELQGAFSFPARI